MGVFERVADTGHEQIAFCHDKASGLRAIIAVHSTALGPSLGGTRFHAYRSEEEALVDALRLSRAMTYKAAAAGLDLGGGKGIIIGDPARHKSEELLRAYGRFVDGLSGRYVTAEDVGTTQSDMDLVRRETRWVTGVSPSFGGSGDPSPATAIGVMHGLRAIALELWGDESLAGRRFAVQGVGKVGGDVARHLVTAGATVTVADVDPRRVDRVASDLGVAAAPSADIHALPCDVFVPCALGGVLNDDTILQLRCAAVGGAANNQLLTPEHGKLLADAGVLYAPDFIINAGGLINVADELDGYDAARAMDRIGGILTTLRSVFEISRSEGVTTAEAAERLAEERLHRVGGLRMLWRGGRA
ncbi:MAG: Glu/Leu/Phe/Val dehydrogenase dimerization domain-containing protein [Actinomycetota bacterium]